MPTHALSPRYCAYLLRCWHAESDGATDLHDWRFSLEDPHTGERYSFASFTALTAFLHAHLISDQRSADAQIDGQAC